MIYFIILIGMPLALIISIMVGWRLNNSKRKRVMKSMFDFWDKGNLE